jgi:hypothetical protein
MQIHFPVGKTYSITFNKKDFCKDLKKKSRLKCRTEYRKPKAFVTLEMYVFVFLICLERAALYKILLYAFLVLPSQMEKY